MLTQSCEIYNNHGLKTYLVYVTHFLFSIYRVPSLSSACDISEEKKLKMHLAQGISSYSWFSVSQWDGIAN